MAAWRSFRETGPLTGSVGDVLVRVHGWLLEGGGPVGGSLRRGLVPRRGRQAGICDGTLLPLPLLGAEPGLRGGGPPQAAVCAGRHRVAVTAWVDVIIVHLNLMFGGLESAGVATQAPSVAQQRLQGVLWDVVAAFVDEAGAWPLGAEIREYLKVAADYSPVATAALPLGSLGGVPPSAADVPLQTVLQDSAPLLARQSVEPSLLLLPACRRPGAVRRPAKLLAKTYPDLVRRNIKVGLQRLAPRRKVWRHRGR